MSSTEGLFKSEFLWVTRLCFSQIHEGKIEKYKLNVNIDGEELDTIPLIRKQCQGKNNTETRCPLVADLIHPYCIECTERELKLRLIQIPKQGFKVIAVNTDNKSNKVPVFKKGDKICRLYGELITDKNFKSRYIGSIPNYDNIVYECVSSFEEKSWSGYSLDCIRYRSIIFYCEESDSKEEYNVSIINIGEFSVCATAEKDIFPGDKLILKKKVEKSIGKKIKVAVSTFQQYTDENVNI